MRGDEVADFGRQALRLQAFEGPGAIDPQRCETVHSRPGDNDKTSGVAFWRKATCWRATAASRRIWKARNPVSVGPENFESP